MTNQPDLIHTLAFRFFAQELDHIDAYRQAFESKRLDAASGYQRTADLCMDEGWDMLEDAGWRQRDIAKFRHEAHKAWRIELDKRKQEEA